MEISAQFRIHETSEWIVGHRMNTALPGYLMVGSKKHTSELSDLPEEALIELGPLLARTQRALTSQFDAKRVYIGRYGHTPGLPIHFHVIPIYNWVEEIFLMDARYRMLEMFSDPAIEPSPDGAELTLFVWREFCERADPPAIEGPSVDAVITSLRNSIF